MNAFFGFAIRAVGLTLLLCATAERSYSLPRPGQSWDETSVDAALEFTNRRGRNPATANAPWNPNLGTPGAHLEDDGGAISGNYRVAIPLLSFAGRGMDFQLKMYYSSQLWSQIDDPANRVQKTLAFNLDGDWPSPGWSLGFGRISSAGLLIGPDNSRQALKWRRNMSTAAGTVSISAVVGDSLLTVEKCCVENKLATAVLRMGDGSSIEYFAPLPKGELSDYYPSRIVDRNGNYISIVYRRDAKSKQVPPAIDTIADTVGRSIKFHYDAQQRPVAVTGPGLELEDKDHVYARFLWFKQSVNVEVKSGDTCAPYTAATAFDGIFLVVLPGTSTGFWVNPFNRYAMSPDIEETRGVVLDAPSLNDQGDVTGSGLMTRRTLFNYPDGNIACLTEPPAYTKRTDIWWDPVLKDNKSVDTNFYKNQNDADTVIAVTHPDKSVSRQFFSLATDPAKFTLAGQVRRIENSDSNGNVLSSTNLEWESPPGLDHAPRQRAIVENIDPLVRGKRTEFFYDRTLPSLLSSELHYGYHNEVAKGELEWASLRGYVRAPEYMAAHIYDLLDSVQNFVGGDIFNTPPVSRVEFKYDEGKPAAVGPIPHHLALYEPHMVRRCAKFEWETIGGKPKKHCIQYKSVPALLATTRGNATTITTFVDPLTAATAVKRQVAYDSTGNVVRQAGGSGSGSEISYEPKSAYSLPMSVVVGSLDAGSALRLKSTFTHYLGAGLPKSTTDPDLKTTQFFYGPGQASWRETQRVLPNQSKKNYAYDDMALTVRISMSDSSNAEFGPVLTLFDGRGKPRRTTISYVVDSCQDPFGYIRVLRTNQASLAAIS
jgi:hypothetical protein